MPTDPLHDALLATPVDPAPRALAARYAPIILFYLREPFLPLAAGLHHPVSRRCAVALLSARGNPWREQIGRPRSW